MLGNRTFYPSLFRVAIGILLLLDVVSGLLYHNDLYSFEGYTYTFDGYLPFLESIREHIQIFLCAYIFVLLLWLLGIGKQITTVLVLIFYILDFYLLHPAVFWGDYVLRITLLFFVFVDSFHFFAIKRDINQVGIIHKLAVLSIMFNVCLVYLDNAIFKLQNPEWMSGYALAYFFEFSQSLDVFNIGGKMMGMPIMIKLATWAVLLFQLTFPFALWFRKLKFCWILIGILIHLLMAVTLQLYKFELIMILLYGFFVTDEEWQRLFDRLNIKLDILHGKR